LFLDQPHEHIIIRSPKSSVPLGRGL